jgi:hypothetical protein
MLLKEDIWRRPPQVRDKALVSLFSLEHDVIPKGDTVNQVATTLPGRELPDLFLQAHYGVPTLCGWLGSFQVFNIIADWCTIVTECDESKFLRAVNHHETEYWCRTAWGE